MRSLSLIIQSTALGFFSLMIVSGRNCLLPSPIDCSQASQTLIEICAITDIDGGWVALVYNMSIFLGYLMPNPFLYK